MKTKTPFSRIWKIAVTLVILSLTSVPLVPALGGPGFAPQSQSVTPENHYIGTVKLNWAAPGVYSDTLTAPATQPDLGSIDLGFLADCSGGNFSGGYVDLSTTQVFPEIDGVGPTISGTCSNDNWQVLSERFTQTTGVGQSVERQFRLVGALDPNAPFTYIGEYRETLWGYGPEPITMVGNFEMRLVNAYALHINAEHGTVTKSPDQPFYHEGDEVTLTPVPDTGWHFFKWTGGLTGNSNPAQIVIRGDATITAVFSKNTYTLTYTADVNGSISGASSQTVIHGESGTVVTAVPGTGYHFVKWSDDSTTNPRTDTNVTGNISVAATFAINTYTISGNAGVAGAAITYTGGSTTADGTGKYTFTLDHGWSGTVTPSAPGYAFIPAKRDYVNIEANRGNQDYSPREIRPSGINSLGIYDGWLLELSEFSNSATQKNNTSSLRVGDDASKRQYRSILSFDTTSLPDKAIITKVTLQIKKMGVAGTDPFTTHGNLVADMKKGFFGLAPLELTDFIAAGAPINTAGRFSVTSDPNWYRLALSPINFKYINLVGTTQFRLRFEKDDDNDRVADYLSIYSGDDANVLWRPVLSVEYWLP